MRLSFLAALIVATVLGWSAITFAAEQPTASDSKHVLRVKRDRANRAVHLVQIDDVVFSDFDSFRRQIESMPAGSVLIWRTPFLIDRVVFEECHWPVDDLAAFCAALGVVCDFKFGCYF